MGGCQGRRAGAFPQRNMKTLLPGPPRCCRLAPSGARKGLVSGQRGSEVRRGLAGEDTSVLHCPGETPVTWNPCKPPQQHDHLKNREGYARLHLLPTGPAVLTGHPPPSPAPLTPPPEKPVPGSTAELSLLPAPPPGSTPPAPTGGSSTAGAGQPDTTFPLAGRDGSISSRNCPGGTGRSVQLVCSPSP